VTAADITSGCAVRLVKQTDDGMWQAYCEGADVGGAIGSTPEDALASLAVVVRVEIALAVERMQP
jgi:hypothetical protein